MRYIYILFFITLLTVLCSWSIDSTTVSKISLDDGEELYLTYCKSCHGKKGNLGIGGAAKLNKSVMPIEDRIDLITEGKGKMAPFAAILTKKEIEAVAKFTMKFSND